MSNRLKQHFPDLDAMMMANLADFGKSLMKKGISREAARQWILDRMDDGPYCLPEVDTELMHMNLITGETQPFVLRAGMVLSVDPDALQELLEEETDDRVAQALEKDMEVLTDSKAFVLWKMFDMGPPMDGINMALGAFLRSEIAEGNQRAEATPYSMLVSGVVFLLMEGVLSYAGEWK